ncbi:hypothetical protein AKL17_1p0067 (plasmid) [Frigidibacter mobilis]|uniref:Uncharacterized protein n=1 Tax=Frigidibacter mobilis TaxID=1335048 RepID=A0A159ZAR6_9RHOB|nr:hypothetical protein AKL17_1p0067 [Frigidibacter mobilis]
MPQDAHDRVQLGTSLGELRAHSVPKPMAGNYRLSILTD